MPVTHPGMEPSPGADPGLLPYRGRVTAVCDGGAPAQAMAVASASRTRRRCLLPLGYEDVEPPPGADPGPSAVRRRSRSRARRRELPSEDSNLDSLIQGQEACH